MITDFLALLFSSIGMFITRNSGGFRLALLVGIALAVLCGYVCHRSAHWWNRRFHRRLAHHALCLLSALITLIFAILYPAVSYFREAGEASIEVWRAAINSDPAWAESTFQKAYNAVRELGIEDFAAVSPPGSARSWIPASHDESRQTAASVYAESACAHFAHSRPFLSKMVWARPGVPAETVFSDVRRWHLTNPTYPIERAIELAVEQIRSRLIAQVPRIVTLSHILTVLLFLLAESVPFGLIGWAAYRDIKIQA